MPVLDTKWNLLVGLANVVVGVLLALAGQLALLPLALFCGAAGAFNLAIWRTHP